MASASTWPGSCSTSAASSSWRFVATSSIWPSTSAARPEAACSRLSASSARLSASSDAPGCAEATPGPRQSPRAARPKASCRMIKAAHRMRCQERCRAAWKTFQANSRSHDRLAHPEFRMGTTPPPPTSLGPNRAARCGSGHTPQPGAGGVVDNLQVSPWASPCDRRSCGGTGTARERNPCVQTTPDRSPPRWLRRGCCWPPCRPARRRQPRPM